MKYCGCYCLEMNNTRSKKIVLLAGYQKRNGQGGKTKSKNFKSRSQTGSDEVTKDRRNEVEDLYLTRSEAIITKEEMGYETSYLQLENDVQESKKSSLDCLSYNLYQNKCSNIPKFKKNWLCNRPLSPPTTSCNSLAAECKVIVHRIDIFNTPTAGLKEEEVQLLEQTEKVVDGKSTTIEEAGNESSSHHNEFKLPKDIQVSDEKEIPNINEVTLSDEERIDKKRLHNLLPTEQVLTESPKFLNSYEALSSEEPFYDSDADPEFIPSTSSEDDHDKIMSPNAWSDSSPPSVVIPSLSPISYNNNFLEKVYSPTQHQQSESWSDITKRRKRQKNFCCFCEDSVTNFARHIERNHPSELEVVKIVSFPRNSPERKNLLTTLRKKGNYLMSAGEKQARPVKKPYKSGTNFLPCCHCLGYYSAKQLWRHKKKCSYDPASKEKSNPQSEGQNALLRNLRIDLQLREQVFPRMRPDDISLVAKKDPLICAFGARYLKIHREKHFINVTSRKMRELARLLMEVRKLEPSVGNLFTALQPQNYDLFVEATKIVAKFDAEKDVYNSPTYAMNIATSLKQCCDIAIIYALKRKNVVANVHSAEAESNLKTMIHLLQSNWKFDISSHAADNLNSEKWNKITLIPLASDLKLLKEYLTAKANNAAIRLTDDRNNQKAYTVLLETVFCRILLLNRRRPGELERLPLHIYENSEINKQQNYEEFSDAITATEKVLMQKFKRIVITGKRKRGVPVLFCSDVQEHLKLLLSTRSNFLLKSNQFLFGRPHLNTPISGYKVMEKHANACGAKNPKALTSTRLRKHLATLTQIFNMSESDIEQLATFMGHTVGTHRTSYRLPDDVYQTAKITKLLLLMEEGGSAEHKGKSLNEIEVNLNEDLLQTTFNNGENDLPNLEEPIDLDFIDTGSDQEGTQEREKNRDIVTKGLKKTRKRQLVPWTEEQKNIVKDFFKRHIATKQPPKRKECEDLIRQYPRIIHNKNWLKIKVFIQNQYTKK